MNTKVKVGIAGAIVAALVALIVLDQKSTSTPGANATAPGPSSAEFTAPLTGGGAPEAVEKNRQQEMRDLLQRVQQKFSPDPAVPAPAPPIAPPLPAPVAAPARSAEYVVAPGDTLGTIAQAKYGSTSYQALIVESNPGLNPSMLPIGKKLVLPPKPEKAEKSSEALASKEIAPVADATGAKTYVVQPGDTLSGISTKVYKTSRNVDKIMAANGITDPHTVAVGMKLTMPDLPVRNAAVAPAAQVQVSAPASGKTHQVQSGDSLWRVAETYATEKGLGILEMMKAIVQANPDKLKDEKTMLRLGWQLIVPE